MSRMQELEAELATLRQQEKDEVKARRESVKPAWAFILAPHTDRYDKIADPSCRWYRLEGVITNSEEYHEVGATKPQEGGMNYLFNTLSGRFVISGGGGTIYISLTGDSIFGRAADTEAFGALEAFIRENPEGGDVTEIVERGRAARS